MVNIKSLMNNSSLHPILPFGHIQFLNSVKSLEVGRGVVGDAVFNKHPRLEAQLPLILTAKIGLFIHHHARHLLLWHDRLFLPTESTKSEHLFIIYLINIYEYF